MPRIITGQYAGRILKVPERGTRPTTDRVREAVFNSLNARMDFEHTYILDLYAGSGALALEALSLGAAHAYCVDAYPGATQIITHNARCLDDPSQCTIITSKVETFLSSTTEHPSFDVILCDPPYEVDNATVTSVLQQLIDYNWLAADALIVVERTKRTGEFAIPESYHEITVKKYGDTRVTLLEWTGTTPVDA